MRLVAAALMFYVATAAGATPAEQRPIAAPAAKPSVTPNPGPLQGKKAAGSVSAKTTRSKATRATRSSARTKSSGATRRSRTRAQQAPTPERYIEIQRALIERGYMTGLATGKWGPECAEALKRFQQDNNLEATGKLNALTLIALGLGPSRSPLSSSPAAEADGQHQSSEKPQ